jgi:membrane-associated phospholipid phosphatase
MPKIAKIVIWVLGIAICVSTQTMKQHYIIDLITALAIAEGFYWLVKGRKIVMHVEQFFTKINRKLNWDWEE